VRLAERDPAPHVRIAALEALTAVAPEMAATVSRRLVRDPDRDVATAALTALAAAGAPDADDVLEDAVHSSDMAVRRGAVQALAQLTTHRAVGTLSWAARADEPSDLARRAIDSLGHLAAASHRSVRDAALDAVVELAAAPLTRSAAIAQLAALPDAVDHLACGLSSPREATRIAVAEGLARMRTRHASEALVAALHDPSAAVRSVAVSAFGRLGAPVAAEAIANLSTDDPDAGVRRLAAAVCRRHQWGAISEWHRR
jgi:HEAT repeat protein